MVSNRNCTFQAIIHQLNLLIYPSHLLLGDIRNVSSIRSSSNVFTSIIVLLHWIYVIFPDSAALMSIYLTELSCFAGAQFLNNLLGIYTYFIKSMTHRGRDRMCDEYIPCTEI